MNPGAEALARQLRWQGAGCARLGAPLYSGLLERCAADVEAGGVIWDLLGERADEPGSSALALRLLAPVHRLVLEGRLPALAGHYRPAAGGPADPAAAWPLFLSAVSDNLEQLRREVARPCQTNDVGRAAALLGGFMALSNATGLPLRLLEIGCSAGLNLRWDRFFYAGAGAAWGDPGSPVRLEDVFLAAPPLQGRPTVIERLGCDLEPVDVNDPDSVLRLRSFIWPEHRLRAERLEGAISIARRVPATVERADALEWLSRRLATPVPGRATVVFHSIFLQYLPEPARRKVAVLVAEAGKWTSADAPLAWLRLEPGPGDFEVRLTTWPGGGERLLATSSPHGSSVRWLG